MAIKINYYNNTHLLIEADRAIYLEISEYFSFYVEGYKFHPAYKSRRWDGRIRLFNVNTKLLPIGLLHRLCEFFDKNQYEYIVDPRLTATNDLEDDIDNWFASNTFKTYKQQQWIEVKPREFQISALKSIVKYSRSLIESPTGSGKSLIIASMFKYLYDRKLINKMLIVVPNLTLVTQMHNDIKEYFIDDTNYDPDKLHHLIYQGQSKHTDKPLVISTYQSISAGKRSKIIDKEWFKQFDALAIDEAHQSEAKELLNVVESSTNAKFKAGFTGSLKEGKTHRVTLEGLFGRVFTTTTTREMIDRGEAANIIIYPIILKYPDDISKKILKMKSYDYQKEVEFIQKLQKRNKLIASLIAKQTGNTLVLFNRIEHGEIIRDLLKEKISKDRKIYFITAKTTKDEREKIRRQLDEVKGAIVMATVSIFSTGVNIPSLDTLILTFSTKSRVRLLQSIGRILRLHTSKNYVKFYDIVDYIKSGKKESYSIKHFNKRVDLYREQQYNIIAKQIDIFNRDSS